MAYGNTSVSSLLRAAKAAQQKQYSLEDSIAAYEYDLSPKTQADFEKYQAHLNNRIKQYQGIDPLKALNYQKTITSANRSFTSSELSRATTQVLYGNMDNPTKLSLMTNLFRRAVENGDENLAQRIEGQAAQLQQIMSRSYGFGGGGGRGSGVGTDFKNSVSNRVAELQSDLDYNVKALRESGNFTLGKIQETGDGRSYLGTAKGLIEEMASTYQRAAQEAEAAGDLQTAQGYKQKYQDIVSGRSTFDAGFGERKLGLNTLNQLIQERNYGNNPTSVAVTPEGSFLKFNQVNTFGQYYKDDAGNIKLMESRNQFRDQDYNRAEMQAIKNLEAKGIQVKRFSSDSKNGRFSGMLTFVNPVTGQEVYGTADQYGNILYHQNDDQGNPIVRRFVTGEGKDEQVSLQEQEAILNNPNAVDQDRAVLAPEDAFKRDVNKYIKKTAAAKMVDDIKKGVTSWGQGWGDFTKEFGGVFSLNPFAQGDAIKKLQGKYDVLKQAKELERRNQEIAMQRANEEANRFLQQQRAAEEARRAKSVVFSRPSINFGALPSLPGNQPDARSIAVVRNQVEQSSPFGGPNPYRI